MATRPRVTPLDAALNACHERKRVGRSEFVCIREDHAPETANGEHVASYRTRGGALVERDRHWFVGVADARARGLA